MLVRCRGVRFGFAEPLFSDVSFDLPRGFTGVVGPNGAGKTTLLRLLARLIEPDSGVVQVRGRVELCPQLVEDEPASFGERKRRQLSAALAAGADVLLLDEPTNHLDSLSRSWLLSELRRFEGIGVVVSHDRELLDALCGATLRVAGGTARLYPGAYSRARPLWESEEQALRAAAEALSSRAKALRERLSDARRDQAAAAGQRSAGRRMRGKYDSDARGLGARFSVERAEKRIGRGVEVLRRAHERAAEEARAAVAPQEPAYQLYTWYTRAPRPWLARLDELSVAREDRIWLCGPNGAGKSTLLRRLVEAMPAGHVLHLPQDLDAPQARAALGEVRALPPVERGHVLTAVAGLGVDPGRLLGSAQPSPGEARKLLIARGLGLGAWALALDEPTNHLDLPSVEQLELALRDYPGALLLVTHDARFAAACRVTREKLVEVSASSGGPA